MRIVFCDNDVKSTYNFREDILRWFHNEGDEVITVSPHFDNLPKPDYVSRSIAMEMKPSGTNIIDEIKYFARLKKLYRELRPDVVINYTIKPNIYCAMAAKSLKIPVIDVVAGLGYIFNNKGLLNKMAQWLFKKGLRCASKVFVLNSHNRNFLEQNRYVLPQNLILLKGGEGLNLRKYHLESKEFNNVRFVLIARVLKDKGYYEFVEAAKIVREKFPDNSFEIVGDLDLNSPMGISKEHLDRDVESKSIVYKGFTSDILKYLNDPNTVVVLPSYHEGLSRSLMEACATGCPIIATDIPGCRETVDEGRNGFLIPPRDAGALAEACIRFIELPVEDKLRMSEESRKKAEKEFDVQRVIDVYVGTIQKLTGK